MAGPDEVTRLVTQAREVMKQVRSLHPTIEPAAYRTRLADIDALATDWQAGDDRIIRGTSAACPMTWTGCAA